MSLHTDPSFGAITLTGVSGASASNIATGVAPSIYGGVAGTCAAATTSTCDSCANTATLSICNRARITSSTILSISYKSSTAAGRPIVTSDNATVIQLGVGSVPINSTATISFPWSSVCQVMTNNTATCDQASVETTSHAIKVGIDANSNGALESNEDQTSVTVQVLSPDPTALGDKDTIDDCTTNSAGDNSPGVCGFLAYPGDEKIFFEDTEAGSGFPTTLTGTIKSINVYASTTGFITGPAGVTPKVLTIEQTTDGFEITNKIVDGLENGVPHYFRTSVSDAAGNEMYFTSDASITANCNGVVPPAIPNFPFDGTGGGDLCPFAAVPDEVVGLLNEDLNCFIATAAFGSTFHPLVADLRHFRDQFLKPYAFGRQFVEWYYSWSPRAASWLRDHKWSLPITRMALVPFWFIAKAITWWPITVALGLVMLGLRRRRQVKRAH